MLDKFVFKRFQWLQITFSKFGQTTI